MFGFGKKTPAPPPREKRARTSGKTKDEYKDDLAKLGLLGLVDGFESDGGGAGSDDSEIDESKLEDELLAMLGEETSSLDALIPESKPKPVAVLPPVPPAPELEALYDAPPPPATISEALDQRLQKYKSELEKATNGGEGTSKIRRLGRIVKQYEDAIAAHRRGQAVEFEELPTPPGFAPIPIPANKAPDQPPANLSPTSPLPSAAPTPAPVESPVLPAQSSPPESALIEVPSPTKSQPSPHPPPHRQPSLDRELLDMLSSRQKQFKEAAVVAKKGGNIEQAREFLKQSKGFDQVIQAAEAGHPVDLSSLPPPPHTATIPSPGAGAEETVPVESGAPTVDVDALFHAPPPPTTILEALDQRLAKYKSELEKATTGGEPTSKLRRLGRIVKQYEDAISAYKKGRAVEFEELPTPPGYAPIPIPGNIEPAPAAAPPPAPAPSPSKTEDPSEHPNRASVNRGANKPQTKLTLQEKQLHEILSRQKHFKEAALNAKKRGDIDQAKELLKTAKGFDKLIQASQAGLPVDMSTLPSRPDAVASLALETSDDFEIVRQTDCLPPPAGSAAEIFAKLEEDLREQLKMCMRTRDHFRSMGDIASANRFEKLAIETKKDLDTLRLSAKQQEQLPKYHYETRIFSITECNSDLADDEIEISILKGINYKVANPADVDTFVKIELPYPSAEEAQTNKTSVVRDTNNPDYNATFKMKINRTARPFQRFIHRHGVKAELWSKGGFLRSSTLLGVATIKLLPLETKTTLHDAFDVMEGRKSVGKLEVKVRVREPVLTKQITQRKEKWLSIDRT